MTMPNQLPNYQDALHALGDGLYALRLGAEDAERVSGNLRGWRKTRAEAWFDGIKDAIRVGEKLGFTLTADARHAEVQASKSAADQPNPREKQDV